jgi:hypothetical protein
MNHKNDPPRSTNDAPSDELQSLTAALVNGALTEADRDRLEELLTASAAAREYYIAYTSLHGRLVRRFRGDAEQAADLFRMQTALEDALHTAGPPAREAAPRSRLRRWMHWAQLGAIDYRDHPLRFLAATLLVTALGWFFLFTFIWPRDPSIPNIAQPGGEIQQPVVAQLVGTHQVEWADDSRTFLDNAFIRAEQSLDIAAGLAEIEFRDGARVVLEGPARFILQSPGSGFLDHGRLTGYAATPARGFTIETRRARVVDVGTEFAVGAARSGATDVYVFLGAVEATGLNALGEPQGSAVRLTANQSLHIDQRGQTAPPPAGEQRRFERLSIPKWDLLADLRRDYKAGISPGDTSAQSNPVTSDGGRWDYFQSPTADGRNLTLLEWSPRHGNYQRAGGQHEGGPNNQFVQVGLASNFRQELWSREVFVHPSDTGSQANEAVYAVLRWTAGPNRMGAVRVLGQVRHPETRDDGVTFKVLVDGQERFAVDLLKTDSQLFDLEAPVAAGSTVDFIVGPGDTHFQDSTMLIVAIYRLRPDGLPARPEHPKEPVSSQAIRPATPEAQSPNQNE